MMCQCGMAEFMFDGIVTCDKGRVEGMNSAAADLLGLVKDHSYSLDALTPELKNILSSVGRGRFSLWRHRPDPLTQIPSRELVLADTIFVGNAEEKSGSLIFRDATNVARLEAKIQHGAFKDESSGLLSQIGFAELAGPIVDRMFHEGTAAACVVFWVPDLADSKSNAAVHDGILSDIGMRIRAGVRGTDLAAYLGGEYFVMMLNKLAAPEHANLVARRIARSVSVPFDSQGCVVRLQTLVGIAILGSDGNTIETLLSSAMKAVNSIDRTNGLSFELHFANPVVQVEEDVRTERARVLKKGRDLDDIGFDLTSYVGQQGKAILIVPAYSGFDQHAIWEEYEKHGDAQTLIEKQANLAANLDADFVVLSLPPQFDRIARNAMVLARTGENSNRPKFYRCCAGSAFGDECCHNKAVRWNGQSAFSALKTAGVELVLVDKTPDSEVGQAEMALANQYFNVFYAKTSDMDDLQNAARGDS